MPSIEQIGQERERIRNAYARREERGAAQTYLRSKPFNLLKQMELEFVYVTEMRRVGLFPLAGKRILDIGCGTGWWLRNLLEYGSEPKDLVGIDLLPHRASRAHSLSPNLAFASADGAEMPFSDAAFDIVMQSMVFTSVLSPQARQAIADEILRILKPGGFLIWYDFAYDNPNNQDVVGLGKSDVTSLFHGARIRGRRLTLAPPLARRIERWPAIFYHLLASLRLLSTHYLLLIQKS